MRLLCNDKHLIFGSVLHRLRGWIFGYSLTVLLVFLTSVEIQVTGLEHHWKMSFCHLHYCMCLTLIYSLGSNHTTFCFCTSLIRFSGQTIYLIACELKTNSWNWRISVTWEADAGNRRSDPRLHSQQGYVTFWPKALHILRRHRLKAKPRELRSSLIQSDQHKVDMFCPDLDFTSPLLCSSPVKFDSVLTDGSQMDTWKTVCSSINQVSTSIYIMLLFTSHYIS